MTSSKPRYLWKATSWLLKKLFRLFLLLSFVLVSNAFMLTNSLANSLFSSFIDRIPGVQSISTQHKKEIAKKNKKIARSKNLTKKIGTRIVSRTKKVTAASLAAIPAESIPFIGISVLLAGTAYEVYAACETVNDLNDIYDALDITEKTDNQTLTAICNPTELKSDIWEKFKRDNNENFSEVINHGNK